MLLHLLTKEILIKNQIQALSNYYFKHYFIKGMKVSKIIFLCLLCCLLNFSAKSQHSVGLIGGAQIPFVNFTDFVIDARYNSAIMTTSYAGITYRFQEHKNVGFQAELAYSVKGWGQSLGEKVNTVKNTISYIEMPIYMRWSILGDSKFNININAGCFAAYAIDHKVSIENDQNLEDIVASYDLQTDNKGDFGVLIGLGISYEFSFGFIQVEGGYRSGFGNILPVNEITKENPIVSTNQTANILVSYLIPINQKNKE